LADFASNPCKQVYDFFGSTTLIGRLSKAWNSPKCHLKGWNESATTLYDMFQ
jgi:hypothetical protein